MQLEYIFQNPLVIVVVLFGMSCTMGLSLVIPIVANVILAVFSGWMGDLAQAAQGKTRESAYPNERDDFPTQVIGYAPGTEPKVVETPALEVEADVTIETYREFSRNDVEMSMSSTQEGTLGYEVTVTVEDSDG